MEDFTSLASRLGAAIQGAGTDADRLLLMETAAHAFAILAAVLIPLAVIYFALRRKEFEFPSLVWFSVCAGAAVALSHGLALRGMWHPDRWLQTTSETAAAALAFCAALMLWTLLPDAVRTPSARQLRRTNATLTRDNLEQQRTVQELRSQTAIYRGWLETIGIGTALVSNSGRWIQINSAFAEALGLSRQELLKKQPRQLLGANLFDGDPATHEREMEIKGDNRWYAWTAVTVPGTEGEPDARLIQCRDISAEKRVKAEITELRQAIQRQEDEKERATKEASARLEQALAERESQQNSLSERAARLARSAAQLEQLSARLTELAGRDPVSGLLSSHALAERLDLALSSARRHARPFSVLIIGMDPLDETVATPEALLAGMGTVLRAELRETDGAARCDEERICVLLPETGLSTAGAIADRIRRRLAATPLATSGGRTLRLTCCIGTAQWKTGQGLSEVLGQASSALRDAQTEGRNRSVAAAELSSKP